MAKALEDALFAGIARDVADASLDVLIRKADELRARLTAPQLEFIIDPSPRKALRSPRRIGKTFGAAAYLCDVALRQRGAECLYLSLTRRSARRLMWRQILRFNADHGLNLQLNHTDMIATFPNGSHILCGGAEDQSDVERYRGGQYDVVVIDECKSFATELFESLLDEVIEPALLDRVGTLCIIGTPGAVLAGAFYQATGPEAAMVRYRDEKRVVESRPWLERDNPGYQNTAYRWSLHVWKPQDNTAIPQLWDRMLAVKESRGWADNHPYWLREYLGQWVADTSAHVYKYDEQRNGWEPPAGTRDEYGILDLKRGLPEGHDWKFVCGMDLGFDDEFSLEVAAYADTHPDFYHVYDFARSGMTVPDIAAAFREAESRFGGFEFVKGDRGGLGKTILATLEEVYGIHVEPADKHEKRDHIELLNGDLLAGRCRILQGSGLAREMITLQWDLTDPRKPKEDKQCPNHRCDGFLYIWRHLYHLFWEERAPTLDVGSAAYIQAMEDAAIEKILARRQERKRREEDFWDDGRASDDLTDLVAGDLDVM